MTAILKEETGYTYIHTEGEHHVKKRSTSQGMPKMASEPQGAW